MPGFATPVQGEGWAGPGDDAVTDFLQDVNGRTILDSVSPVGDVKTYPINLAKTLVGATFPDTTFHSAFLGFDKATTESAYFMIGSLLPDHWRSVEIHVEGWNFTGGAGDVRWRVTDAEGTDTDTTLAYTDAIGFDARRIGAAVYTLDTFTVGDVTRPGGVYTISRVGGDAADTLDGDIHLAAIHLVRVS